MARHALAFDGGRARTVERGGDGVLVVEMRASDPDRPGVTRRYWVKLVK